MDGGNGVFTCYKDIISIFIPEADWLKKKDRRRGNSLCRRLQTAAAPPESSVKNKDLRVGRIRELQIQGLFRMVTSMWELRIKLFCRFLFLISTDVFQ